LGRSTKLGANFCNLLEIAGRQVFYQVDKDWHYRKEERRWVPMNDRSSWY